MNEPWYESYASVVALARYLADERDYTADQLLGYLMSPWNWSREYGEYRASLSRVRIAGEEEVVEAAFVPPF